MGFWSRFVGKTVVIEYRAWTGQVRFIACHEGGPCTPVWLELQTLGGKVLFVRSDLLDVIREPVTEDLTGTSGLTMISLAGMLYDDRGAAEPPPESGNGDSERISVE